jgi:predicted GNAT superfamily acetyltransferase
MVIREARAEDCGAIVALNEREVQQTSAMDLQRLHELACMSSYLKVAETNGCVAAFLLAMREGAP